MSSILGITFSPKTKAEIEDLPNKKSLGVLHVVTANPEMLMASMKDQQLQSILQESEYVVADGIGLQWLCRLTGQAIPTRIPGVDLMVAWLEHANEYRKSVVFVGGTEQVALKLRKVLAKVYPRVRVEHVYDITVDGEGKSVQTASVLNSISAVLPDFIFVALGHGKQEKWLDSNKDY
ncbi:MAG: WecB/TagA/CpsF family glycosyltransferase, partial [Zetaproteobacteria bacterium]|nr:WecB/TagA/CpsF family glycosyltransferase [Zetaproteobacteria bacterium]